MKIKNTNNIIGFTYFGQTIIVPLGWWLAVDASGQLYAHRNKPNWDTETQSWYSTGNYDKEDFILRIGDVEDLPVHPESSLVNAKITDKDLGPSHPVDFHNLKLLQAVVGKPNTNLYMTDKQYHEKLEVSSNSHDKFFKDILPTLVASSLSEWCWLYNPANAKHISINMDLRTCSTIVTYIPNSSDQRERILPELLQAQSSNRYFVGYEIDCNLRNNGTHSYVISQHGLHLNTSRHTVRGDKKFLFEYFKSIKPISVKLKYNTSDINKRDGKSIKSQIDQFFIDRSFTICGNKS